MARNTYAYVAFCQRAGVDEQPRQVFVEGYRTAADGRREVLVVAPGGRFVDWVPLEGVFVVAQRVPVEVIV